MLAATAIAITSAACGTTRIPSPAPRPAGPVLAVAPAVGVTFIRDLNPFDPGSTASALGIRSLIYEPLYEIDALPPQYPGVHPWLATAYAFAGGGRDLRITIRDGVRFSDGSAFGPADVAATFRAMRHDAGADYSGVPLQSADPTVDVATRTVTLHFATPQYSALWAVLGSTYMVPAALVTRLGSHLTTGTVSDPVGTGPFALSSFSPAEMRFTPNPHYWGGPPPESEIDIPDFANANSLVEALGTRRLDWWAGGVLLPMETVDYVSCPSATCIDWSAGYPVGSTLTLDFNLQPGNGGAKGIDDPAVRQAVSLGIDRTVLSSIGESGYEAAATSAGGLTPVQQAVYPDPAHADDLPADAAATPASAPGGWTGATVQSVLEQDGWTPPAGWGTSAETPCDGADAADCWTRDGQIISFSIWNSESLPDIWADAQEISFELQAEGMDVFTDQAAGGSAQWQEAIDAGDFQSTIHAGAGGDSPFVQLDGWLDEAVDCSGVPTTCPAGDYGRFRSSAVEGALQEYAGADPATSTGQATIAAAIATLEGIMARQVPDVPLLYGADWNIVSTVDYTGWPDQSDPYMDPSPGDPQLPYILMHLRPVR
jgi:peptide/nickel transport system substrate-binding protein